MQQIRELNSGDIPRAISLVRSVFMEYNAPAYGERGLETFLSFIAEENIKEQLRQDDMRLYGSFDGDTLLGVLALTRGNHVSLLFTDGCHQRRGIAKAMVRRAEEQCQKAGYSCLTVNADLSAAAAYRAMGFYEVSPETERDGIRFQPMELPIA